MCIQQTTDPMHSSDNDFDDDDYDYDNNPFSSPFVSSHGGSIPGIPEASNPFAEEAHAAPEDTSATLASNYETDQPESSNERVEEDTPSDNTPNKSQDTSADQVNEHTTKLQHLRETHEKFLQKYQLLVKVSKITRTLPANSSDKNYNSRVGNGATGPTTTGSISSNSTNNGRNTVGKKDGYRSSSNDSSSFTSRPGDLVIYMEVFTNLPTFRKKTNKNVIKSYKEFENFCVYLQDFRLDHFHEFFPPALPLNKTSYGLSNAEDLIQCKINFQKWFDLRICGNVKIMKLEELAIFLESDYNTYLPMNGCMNVNNNTTTSVISTNHSLDHLNSNDTMIAPTEQLKRKTLKQFQPPFDPVQELATFRPMIKYWRKNLQMLQVGLFKMCKQRQALSYNESVMGKNYIKMSENMVQIDGFDKNSAINNDRSFSNNTISRSRLNSIGNNSNINSIGGNEVAKKFSNMYKRLGKTMVTIGDMDSIMTTFNMATLYDGLEWCCRDLYNVKEQLTNRHLLMRELNNVSANLKKNQEHIRKLRSKRDTNPLKIDECMKNLQKVCEQEAFWKTRLAKITENLQLESETGIIKIWEQQNIQFMKDYALKNIEYERKKLNILERIRSDVRKTDKSGGLSRLGRPSFDQSMSGMNTGADAPQVDTTTIANPNVVNTDSNGHSKNIFKQPNPSMSSNDSWSGDNRKEHKYYSEIEKELLANGNKQLLSSANNESLLIQNDLQEDQESGALGESAAVNKEFHGNNEQNDNDTAASFVDWNTKKYAANLLGRSTF